jgi:hypothetical protein
MRTVFVAVDVRAAAANKDKAIPKKSLIEDNRRAVETTLECRFSINSTLCFRHPSHSARVVTFDCPYFLCRIPECGSGWTERELGEAGPDATTGPADHVTLLPLVMPDFKFEFRFA